MDKISVLISVYNEPIDWIESALLSLKNQIGLGVSFNVEVCLVLDSPKRKEEISNANLFLGFEGVEINYIVNDENLGLARSLNIAANNSTGNFIARLDADDICYPNRFMSQLEFLKKNVNSHVGLVGTGIERIDENGHHLSYAFLPSKSEILKRWVTYKAVAYHPTWLMRKDVFFKLKGYRPYPNSQDLDFILRAFEQGVIVSNLNSPLLKYRINSASLSISHSLRQRKCQYHIIKQSRLRKTQGSDKFSEAEMLNYISSRKIVANLHSISQRMFIKSRDSDSSFCKMFFFLGAVIISPYQMLHVFRMLYFKIFIEKYSE
ncbi:glycosyltransferase [Vibrio owensii]|uniref:glycosyltransferase n=1 Tax=Vibrio owensii TaxID=696485 RepID=UPI003396DD18